MLYRGDESSVRLKKRFEKRELEKFYLALTYGVPRPMSGVVDIPIAIESLVKANYRVSKKSCQGFICFTKIW